MEDKPSSAHHILHATWSVKDDIVLTPHTMYASFSNISNHKWPTELLMFNLSSPTIPLFVLITHVDVSSKMSCMTAVIVLIPPFLLICKKIMRLIPRSYLLLLWQDYFLQLELLLLPTYQNQVSFPTTPIQPNFQPVFSNKLLNDLDCIISLPKSNV